MVAYATITVLLTLLPQTVAFSAHATMLKQLPCARSTKARLPVTTMAFRRQLALGVAGVSAQPVIWASLYNVATTGGGLPAGPFGLIGLLEGISYLIIVYIVGTALISKVRTGSGLPSGPYGVLGLAEGLSFISVTAGLGVLAYVATGQGCIPNAQPIADYSDIVKVCR